MKNYMADVDIRYRDGTVNKAAPVVKASSFDLAVRRAVSASQIGGHGRAIRIDLTLVEIQRGAA